jgi:hypothetical protein
MVQDALEYYRSKLVEDQKSSLHILLNAYILGNQCKKDELKDLPKDTQSLDYIKQKFGFWKAILTQINHLQIIKTLHNCYLDKTVLHYSDRILNTLMRICKFNKIEEFSNYKEFMNFYYNSYLRLNNDDDKIRLETFYDSSLFKEIENLNSDGSVKFEASIEKFLLTGECFDINYFEIKEYDPIKSTLSYRDKQRYEIIKFLNHLIYRSKPKNVNTTINGSYTIVSRNNNLVALLEELDTIASCYKIRPDLATIKEVITNYNKQNVKDLFLAKCRRILNKAVNNAKEEQKYLLQILKLLGKQNDSFDKYYQQLLNLNAVYNNTAGTYFILNNYRKVNNRNLIRYADNDDRFYYMYEGNEVTKTFNKKELKYIKLMSKLNLEVFYQDKIHEITALRDILINSTKSKSKETHEYEELFYLYFKLFSKQNKLDSSLLGFIYYKSIPEGTAELKTFLELCIHFVSKSQNLKLINVVLPVLVSYYIEIGKSNIDNWTDKSKLETSLRVLIGLLDINIGKICYDQLFVFRNSGKELRQNILKILIKFYTNDPHYYAFKMLYLNDELNGSKDGNAKNNHDFINKHIGENGQKIIRIYHAFGDYLKDMAKTSKDIGEKKDDKSLKKIFNNFNDWFSSKGNSSAGIEIILPYLSNKAKPAGERIFIKHLVDYKRLTSATWPIRLIVKGSDDKDHSLLVKYDERNWEHEVNALEVLTANNNVLELEGHSDLKMLLYNIEPIYQNTILCEWVNDTNLFLDKIDNLLTNNGVSNLQPYDREPYEYNVFYQNFTHKTVDPNIYYENKIELTKSMALWSISGHLIGLGDRHNGNIMICEKDCKIVHIDLAYIMGLGRKLRVPEVVEFRFTPNLRRTLGLLEGNGLFFYYSVLTLKVYSKYKHYILSKYYSILTSELAQPSFLEKFNDVKSLLSTGGNYTHYVQKLIRTCMSDPALKSMFGGWASVK